MLRAALQSVAPLLVEKNINPCPYDSLPGRRTLLFVATSQRWAQNYPDSKCGSLHRALLSPVLPHTGSSWSMLCQWLSRSLWIRNSSGAMHDTRLRCDFHHLLVPQVNWIDTTNGTPATSKTSERRQCEHSRSTDEYYQGIDGGQQLHTLLLVADGAAVDGLGERRPAKISTPSLKCGIFSKQAVRDHNKQLPG